MTYGMKKSRLQLLPHDPAWADDFAAEKRRIVTALDDASARIEHVGSTAIPTVHAKPILDLAILCGAKGLAHTGATLAALGYDYRGRFDENEPDHYYAALDRGDVRLCQAHIFTAPNADWHSKLRFRDVLARDLKLAREYDEYKLRLAEACADKTEYAAIKTRWVDDFMKQVDAGAGE